MISSKFTLDRRSLHNRCVMSNITTKRAMDTALKKILQSKPLNKVTIQDIADECCINRMTFYYHFQDIYELVEWICHEDGRKALEGNQDYATWQQGYLNIFNTIKENRVFIMSVYRGIGLDRIEKYLYLQVHQLIMNIIEEESDGMRISDEQKGYLADFYTFPFVGFVLRWIQQDMQEDPGEIVGMVSTIVEGNLVPACRRFEQSEGTMHK